MFKIGCLIDFLTDSNQKSLISMVQNRDETFEHALDSYRQLFLVEMEYCKKKNSREIQEDSKNEDRKEQENQSKEDREFFCDNKNCYFSDGCYNIYEELKKIESKVIEDFFNGIRSCYMCWIDSHTTKALEAFENILIDKDLIYPEGARDDDELLVKDIANQVYFRGRMTEDFLGKRDMFHVPYNKRYNLKNERFSLTGQPILYLGNSVADVVEELDVEPNDDAVQQRLKISSFEIKDSHRKKKIFDLRCDIGQDLKNIKSSTFTRRKFFRNLLSFICSFQKRKELEGYAFKEEYVIPQMLSQILKKNHYDGICFYSTKKFYGYKLNETCIYSEEFEKDLRYRENIVLFTHVSNDGGVQTYDEELWNGLEISMPISIQGIKRSSRHELQNLSSVINEKCKDIFAKKKEDTDTTIVTAEDYYKKVGHYCKKVDSITKSYFDVFDKLRYRDEFYSKTLLGKIQLQLLVGILNRILVEIEISDEPNQKKKEVDKAEYQVQCCDVLGVGGKTISARKAYDEGILHKGEICLITRMMQKGSVFEIAVHRKDGRDIFHERVGHQDEKTLLYELIQKSKTEKIGAFLHQEISMEGYSKEDFAIKQDFEYIEVMLTKVAEEENVGDEVVWMTVDEVKDKLSGDYNKLSGIDQKALQVVLRHLQEAVKNCGSLAT